MIHYWARLGALVPGLVNAITQSPGIAALAKLASGMPAQRRIPPFAPYTFTEWFRHRPQPDSSTGRRVVLWPDTFNNHFHPRTAVAAVRVLERAGCRVEVPAAPVCCGRPLYDYGMLDTAKAWLLDTARTLKDQIQEGVPIVGLEPSCVAVFRDEARELLPDREDIKRLSAQTFTLSEFLRDIRFEFPALHRKAIVHGHCHHKAIMKMDAEEQALHAMGLDCKVLDAGCCGMAGSFGFERDHYDVSMKVGERVLLPAVREAPRDTLIVADGFSCRTQIEQATDRRALHLADVLEMAAREGANGPRGEYPERDYVPDYGPYAEPVAAVALAAGALAGASMLMYLLVRRARGRRQPVTAVSRP